MRKKRKKRESKKRKLSKKEKARKLENYAEDLRKEIVAVEERIKELKS